MNLPNTSFNETSHERYVIDSGTLFANMKWTEEGWTYEELGSTEGSVSIDVEMSYRQMEVNGANHVAVKQHMVLEEFNATATANVKEISAKLIAQAINGKIETEGKGIPTGYAQITPQRFLDENSFFENIGFTGRLKRNGQLIIAILDNPRAENGFSGETSDGAEMAVEQVYRAHADVKDLRRDPNYLPLRWFVPDSLVDGVPQQLDMQATGEGIELQAEEPEEVGSEE